MKPRCVRFTADRPRLVQGARQWAHNKRENLIEITEIPYTTTIEAIIDKIAELVKSGKVREIADVRDETDLSGLKIAIDLKRGADPDKLMARLMKMTPLMDSFSCNFNVLIGGMPRVLGVPRTAGQSGRHWRTECVRRRALFFDLNKKKDKLHPAYLACRGSCSTSTRRSRSSVVPRRTPRLFPI